MELSTFCGCHEDYHELGVHRPGCELSAASVHPGADLAVVGAA